MAIGTNVNLKDKLIRKTSKTSNMDNKSNDDIKRKDVSTKDTQKMTFYIKNDLMQELYNYAYWERYNITDAFNLVIKDGLKGKTTKEIKR